ncbi:hypothetical protein EMPS_09461 [Entomortierella parvispora]|uniref:Uncharacterized protein n=1 Tax=Entomortierella parvispora TaxID=205924 RepID=A0A9P3HIV9_9FUNG|nr:hypothetical protein EMPS_09461 [Entomortierella parvispora]
MTPNVPNTAQGSSSRFPPVMTSPAVGPQESIAATNDSMDKKRSRRADESGHTRKKIAGELMVVFESLSLSRDDISDAAASTTLRRRPPVQNSATDTSGTLQLVQNEPWQLRSQNPQHLQQDLTEQHSPLPDMENHRTQGADVLHVNTHATKSNSSYGGPTHSPPTTATGSGSLSPTSLSSAQLSPVSSQVSLHGSHFGYLTGFSPESSLSAGASSSVSASLGPSFSPPSPPISPVPTGASAFGMDVSMSMDEELPGPIPRPMSSGSSSHDSSGTQPHSSASNVKTLTLRQRKWNSDRKEWQEWQDVEATHVSDLQSYPQGYSHGSSSHTAADHQADFTTDPYIVSGSIGNQDRYQGQSSVLGRQRSLNGSKNKALAENQGMAMAEDTARSSFGTRARSFSETNVHIQHFASLPGLRSPPSPQIAAFQTQQQQDHSHQHRRHRGHFPRNYSDHGYGQQEEVMGQTADFDDGFYRLSQHGSPVPGSRLTPPNVLSPHPWTGLSMTALDGTMNLPGEQFGRLSLQGNMSLPSSPPSSSGLHLSNQHRPEELSTWSQQLLQSQNAYREGSRRSGFGRASPGQYSQYHQHHHQSLEDVSMGEELTRTIPSRSSSPAPCLSMAPIVPRPLSISFSHMSGSNLLGDLAEHEQDDDMEL